MIIENDEILALKSRHGEIGEEIHNRTEQTNFLIAYSADLQEKKKQLLADNIVNALDNITGVATAETTEQEFKTVEDFDLRIAEVDKELSELREKIELLNKAKLRIETTHLPKAVSKFILTLNQQYVSELQEVIKQYKDKSSKHLPVNAVKRIRELVNLLTDLRNSAADFSHHVEINPSRRYGKGSPQDYYNIDAGKITISVEEEVKCENFKYDYKFGIHGGIFEQKMEGHILDIFGSDIKKFVDHYIDRLEYKLSQQQPNMEYSFSEISPKITNEHILNIEPPPIDWNNITGIAQPDRIVRITPVMFDYSYSS